MPIFDYKCNGCENEFEMLVRSSEAVVQCEKCGSENVERKISAFSVGQISNGCAVQGDCHSGHKCGGHCSH